MNGWMNLQVLHIQVLVLEKSSWYAQSVSFPPSLCLSSVGPTPQGLSPIQTTQQEKSKQRDQNEKSQFQCEITIVMTGQMRIGASESTDMREMKKPVRTQSSHPPAGRTLNLLTSASALCGFFASVFERVALANQQQATACSRNKIVPISTEEKEKEKQPWSSQN